LPKDVLLPEAGRNVAAKIGAEYCETSVLEEFGLDHVFMNVIRAALVGRRSRHFYLAVGPLKNIEPPALQVLASGRGVVVGMMCEGTTCL